jgi:cytochrome c
MWRNRVAPVIIVCGMVLVTLGVLPAPRKTNPVVTPSHTLQANVNMTPEAAAILQRACMNCHSNETRWPLYSQFAPFSWLVVRDVQRARKLINFSEWSVQAGRRPELAASTLAATCTDMTAGRMPTAAYLIVHPEAKLSKQDIQTYCGWTKEEVRRQIEIKRRQRDRRPNDSSPSVRKAGLLPKIYKTPTNRS